MARGHGNHLGERNEENRGNAHAGSTERGGGGVGIGDGNDGAWSDGESGSGSVFHHENGEDTAVTVVDLPDGWLRSEPLKRLPSQIKK